MNGQTDGPMDGKSDALVKAGATKSHYNFTLCMNSSCQ